MKVMAAGNPAGTSFKEDYTYHFTSNGSSVPGAHMLEVCPSITATQPSCEIHPVAIGGQAALVRLVFTAPSGPGIVAGLLDFGDRFCLVINTVEVVETDEAMPRLPVARALCEPQPLPDWATRISASLALQERVPLVEDPVRPSVLQDTLLSLETTARWEAGESFPYRLSVFRLLGFDIEPQAADQ